MIEKDPVMNSIPESNNVMCAVDVNDVKQDLIDIAAEFARAFETDLDIVHVTLYPEPANTFYPGYLGVPDSVVDERENLKQIKPSNAKVKVVHHQLLGIPERQLLKFIESHQPRMVVIGSRGRRGLSRVILGSVAEQVMRKAHCPVLVYRHRANEPAMTQSESHDRKLV